MAKVLESKYRPSRKLLDHTAAMIAAQSDFVLLDEQLVAFNSVLADARAGFHETKKSVVIIQGGPGTGKSVIALHLVGELARQGYNAQHATGSKAFTENVRRVVGRRAGNSQFRYFNQFGNAAANDVDVLILDEAHRLRSTSVSRFTPKAKRTELTQVDELIAAAKTSVFFIDDLQGVRPNEVGSTDVIAEAALRAVPSSPSSSSRRSSAAPAPRASSAGSTTRLGSTRPRTRSGKATRRSTSRSSTPSSSLTP
jgi:hypothetical protein